MRRNLLIILGLLIVTGGYTYLTNHNTAVAPTTETAPQIRQGNPAPDFSYTDLNDKKGKLSDLKGKVVVLNFWASWCTPCVAEFPVLLTLAATFPKDVVLLAVSSDHDKAAMDRFLIRLKKENGAKATAPNVVIVWDEDQSITQKLFQTTRLPETILVDSNLIMQDKIAGIVDWTGVPMAQKIRGYMTQKP
jgi:thiol-disulfide isomerase/thioredoxin